MNRIVRIIAAALLGVMFMGNCFAAEDAAAFIDKAELAILEGNKEKAVEALDAAFESADAAGDYDTLMEIGDLYVSVDPSLKEKAMRSWTTAGRWKVR